MTVLGYVYKTTCWLDGRVYIGQRRGKFNSSYLGSGLHLKLAIKKYDKGNFSSELIQYGTSQEELNVLEKCCIATARSILQENHVFNIANGGTSVMEGRHHTQALKDKWSKDRKGKTVKELGHRENCACAACESLRGNKPAHTRRCNCIVCFNIRTGFKKCNRTCPCGNIFTALKGRKYCSPKCYFEYRDFTGENNSNYSVREVRICLCGCKKTFECTVNSKRKFFGNGHANSGLKRSLRTKQLIASKLIGNQNRRKEIICL